MLGGSARFRRIRGHSHRFPSPPCARRGWVVAVPAIRESGCLYSRVPPAGVTGFSPRAARGSLQEALPLGPRSPPPPPGGPPRVFARRHTAGPAGTPPRVKTSRNPHRWHRHDHRASLGWRRRFPRATTRLMYDMRRPLRASAQGVGEGTSRAGTNARREPAQRPPAPCHSPESASSKRRRTSSRVISLGARPISRCCAIVPSVSRSRSARPKPISPSVSGMPSVERRSM